LFSIRCAKPLFLLCLCRRLKDTGRGLGADSEQTLEASHTDFARIWQRYRVRDTTSKIYGTQLLASVLNFNASHTPEQIVEADDCLVSSDQAGIFQGPTGAGAVKYAVLLYMAFA